jgi:LysR family transcriptional regulator, glycine cleavage system transcriptional activator
MKRICPSISELLAFDAVARQGSLTLAALELCVTVSAISKQLASLESFLNQRLFRRDGRGVVLTPLGSAFAQKIAPSLRGIESATLELRGSSHGTGLLTLASVPTFLTKWLIPRLPKFRTHSPSTTISFSRHLNHNEDIPPGVDAAIRYGTGEWPNVNADYIAGKEFVVVYSPKMLKVQAKSVITPYLAKHTLLHHEQASHAWGQWAEAYDLSKDTVVAGPRFAQYSALIQAAVSGLGFGLVPQVLVLEELEQGVLRKSREPCIEINQGHYLCYPAERLQLSAFSAFRDWVLLQARASG